MSADDCFFCVRNTGVSPHAQIRPARFQVENVFRVCGMHLAIGVEAVAEWTRSNPQTTDPTVAVEVLS